MLKKIIYHPLINFAMLLYFGSYALSVYLISAGIFPPFAGALVIGLGMIAMISLITYIAIKLSNSERSSDTKSKDEHGNVRT